MRLSWINNKNDKTSLNDKTVNVHSLTPSYENDKTIFEENRPNIHDSTDANKSKTNIDMLLFETTPNKTTRVNLEDKKGTHKCKCKFNQQLSKNYVYMCIHISRYIYYISFFT